MYFSICKYQPDNQHFILEKKEKMLEVLEHFAYMHLFFQERHTSFIETRLLDQVRVIWSGLVLPVWVEKNICVFLKIGKMFLFSFSILKW